MMKWFTYLKIDCKRMVGTVRFWIAIVAVPCILLCAIMEDVSLDSDVCGIFSIVMYSIPSNLVLICGTLAFATSLCEDIEHKYMIQEIIRGSIRPYIMARVTSIFLAAVVVSATGMLAYVWILHVQLPWSGVSEIYEEWLEASGFQTLLKAKYYGVYFLLYGIQYGALAGILALWAAYISLFVSNSMLVISFPLIGYYFFNEIWARLFVGAPEISLFFTASFNLFRGEWTEFVCVVVVSLIHIIVLGGLMIRRIRRRYYG